MIDFEQFRQEVEDWIINVVSKPDPSLSKSALYLSYNFPDFWI